MSDIPFNLTELLTDLTRRLNDLEKAVDRLEFEAATTTPQTPEAVDKELRAIWAKPGSVMDGVREIYNLGREHGSPVTPAPEPTCEPAPVFPPADCAMRLMKEEKSCSSLCAACGDCAPNWGLCRRALAQELPAPAGGLLDQVAAAIAKGRDNRFPDEQYRSDAKWAIRAVARWLSDERWDVDVYHAAAVLREAMEHG